MSSTRIEASEKRRVVGQPDCLGFQAVADLDVLPCCCNTLGERARTGFLSQIGEPPLTRALQCFYSLVTPLSNNALFIRKETTFFWVPY